MLSTTQETQPQGVRLSSLGSTVNIMSGRGGDYDTTRGKGVGGGGGGGLAELDNDVSPH